MPDDRESVTIELSGQSFTIDAPKGLSNDDIIRRTVRADKDFASLAVMHPKLRDIATQEQARSRSMLAVPPPPTEYTGKPSGASISYRGAQPPREGETKTTLSTLPWVGGATAAALTGGTSLIPQAIAAGGGGILGSLAKQGIEKGAGTRGQVSTTEALTKGTEVGGTELVGGAITKVIAKPLIEAGGWMIRPFLQKAEPFASETALQLGVTKRVYELATMADAEEGLRKTIVAAPRLIRKNIINPLYPEITEAVDLYAPSKQAIKSTGQQIAHGTPAELLRTKNIGRQIAQIESNIEELVAQDRSLATDPMQQTELLDTLEALKSKRSITFKQAQNLRSALGRALARGQGYKIPGEVFQTLRSVHNLVEDGMRATAESAGKLEQWQTADKVYSQFMQDFYNKNAPLKGVLDVKERMTGRTLRRLLRPDTSHRAEIALRRWGLNDQADALRKIVDMPDRAQALKKMEEFMASSKAFSSQELSEARATEEARIATSHEELKRERAKRLKIVGAGGAAYEAYRILRGGRP